MGLESATYIPELTITNPVGATDQKAEGDDHLRLIKKTLSNTFGAFVGTAGVPKSVTLTEDQINDAVRKAVDNILTGRLETDDSTTTRAGFNIPDGVAPTSPVQGDIWATSSDVLVRNNGSDKSIISAPITRIAGSSGAAGADITWQNLTANALVTSTTNVVVMTTTGVVPGSYKFQYTVIFQTSVATTGVGFMIGHSGTVGNFAARMSHVTNQGTTTDAISESNTNTVNLGSMEAKHGSTINGLIGSLTEGVDLANADILMVIEGIVVVTATGQLELGMRGQTTSEIRILADSCLELLKIQ